MGTPRERVRELVLESERLRVRLAEIDRQIDSLLLPDEGVSPPTGAAAQVSSVRHPVVRKMFVQRGEQIPGSLPAQLMERMSASPGRVFQARDFSDLHEGMQNVRSSLSRLAKKGHIEKLAVRGRYRLPPEPARRGASH